MRPYRPERPGIWTEWTQWTIWMLPRAVSPLRPRGVVAPLMLLARIAIVSGICEDARSSSVAKAARRPRRRLLLSRSAEWAGWRGWFGALPPGVGRRMFAVLGSARLWSG